MSAVTVNTPYPVFTDIDGQPLNATGSRTLAAYGMATAVKITSTSWIISGTGLT